MNDDKARRRYWTESMDAACDFMQRVCLAQVNECMEKPVPLRDAADEAGVKVAFSDTKIAGKLDRRFDLREGLIDNFLGAAREMNERGWILKVEDGYRTADMQKSLAADEKIFESILRSVMWEHEGKRPPIDALFRRVSALVATRPAHATHMSASAMDISVLNRDDGTEVRRGGPYLEMSALTPMDSPFVAENEAQNRRAITEIMARRGLAAYPYEFWHYSGGDAVAAVINGSEKSAIYGPIEWNPDSGDVTPIDRMTPLTTEDTIRDILQSVMDRTGNEN